MLVVGRVGCAESRRAIAFVAGKQGHGGGGQEMVTEIDYIDSKAVV